MVTFAGIHAYAIDDNPMQSLVLSLNLPSMARVAAESNNLIVFASVYSTCNEMGVVTLWAY